MTRLNFHGRSRNGYEREFLCGKLEKFRDRLNCAPTERIVNDRHVRLSGHVCFSKFSIIPLCFRRDKYFFFLVICDFSDLSKRRETFVEPDRDTGNLVGEETQRSIGAYRNGRRNCLGRPKKLVGWFFLRFRPGNVKKTVCTHVRLLTKRRKSQRIYKHTEVFEKYDENR